MKSLSFDAGLEEYRLNDRVTVHFNPTDLGFLEKLASTFEKLDALQEEVRASGKRSRTRGKCSPSPVTWTQRCA